VGIPFLLVGLILLVVALAVGTWRYMHASQVVNVLRTGESTQGQVTDVQKDYSVRVNRQHPWVIRYQFQVNGRDFEGDVRTLNSVGARLQTGELVWILYLPNAPQWNSIYPHPRAHRAAQHSVHWMVRDSPPFSRIFLASSFLCPRALSMPVPPPVAQTARW
jgi:hypothetical protein